MDPEEQVGNTVVDDDDGDIAGLIDLLVDEETAEETEDSEQEEESQEETDPEGDTPDEEESPEDEPDAPAGGENPELEQLRQENAQYRQAEERRQAQFQAYQREQQQREHAKRLNERFNSLEDIADPDIRNREFAAILHDVRTQERNVFLPQVNAAEQQAETNAQGIVALHYAVEGFISDLVSGDLDITGMKAEEVLAQVQDKAVKYMEFESAADLQRDIARQNELKSQTNAKIRSQAAEIEKLKKQNAALKLARNPVNQGSQNGKGGNGSVAKEIGAIRKDDDSLGWLIDSLDVPEDEEVATGAY